MAIDERRRAEAYQRLEAVIGPEAATTIFEHLPPVGWADVATKHDLEQHRVATKQDLESLKHELTAMFRGELVAQTRTIIFTMMGTVLGTVLGVGGFMLAAASRLAGAS